MKNVKKTWLRARPFSIVFSVLLLAGRLQAQQIAAFELPDAPQAQGSASQPPEQTGPQAQGVLKLLPGFRSMSADQHPPPQTVKDKFKIASRDSFSYSAFMISAVVAGEEDARGQTPEFGNGGVAYGRYLWHAFVDRASEIYFVEFIVPAATHEDTRYYRLGPGHGTMRRGYYALSRAVVTRNDAGNETFNAGEVIGAGAAAGVSNLYYPPRDRTFENTASNWGTNVGIDAATFVVREFWPDITHKLFRSDKTTAGH